MRVGRCGLSLIVLLELALGQVVRADEPRVEKSAADVKKVLVELYTSQGCNSCPAAEKVFGDLAKLGVDAGRVVPVAFHVDYFNQPWADPYSDPVFSRREYQYSLIYQKQKKIADPNYLYFTPMMMCDGVDPMLGSNASEAKRAISRALGRAPGARIAASLSGSSKDARRRLSVEVRARSSEMVGRPVLVAVALTENPVQTKVDSGENAGKTLVEHFATRSFQGQEVKFARSETKTFAFEVVVPKGVTRERLALAIFVQDLGTGRIHQAESVAWVEKP